MSSLYTSITHNGKVGLSVKPDENGQVEYVFDSADDILHTAVGLLLYALRSGARSIVNGEDRPTFLEDLTSLSIVPDVLQDFMRHVEETYQNCCSDADEDIQEAINELKAHKDGSSNNDDSCDNDVSMK
jgi:hypothetical protein